MSGALRRVGRSDLRGECKETAMSQAQEGASVERTRRAKRQNTEATGKAPEEGRNFGPLGGFEASEDGDGVAPRPSPSEGTAPVPRQEKT